MKKAIIFILGLMLFLSGMQYIPVHASGGTINMAAHCSLCLDQGKVVNHHNLFESENKSVGQRSPSRCRCNFDSHSTNNDKETLISKSQPLKEKSYFIRYLGYCTESIRFNKEFISTEINKLCSSSYIKTINTVQQLK